MVLAMDAQSREALVVRLGALEELLEPSGEVNHYETMWLRHRIRATREQLEHRL